jgi:hypothetical protein
MSKSFLQANAPVATQASVTSAAVPVLATDYSFLYGKGLDPFTAATSVAGSAAYSVLVSNVGAATLHWSFGVSMAAGVTGHPIEPNQSIWLTLEPDATVYINNTSAIAVAYVYSLWT